MSKIRARATGPPAGADLCALGRFAQTGSGSLPAHEYLFACDQLLGPFAIDWYHCLTGAERRSHFDAAFSLEIFAAGEVLAALSQALRGIRKKSPNCGVVCGQVKGFLRQGGFRRVVEALIEALEVAGARYGAPVPAVVASQVRACVALPTLLANAHGGRAIDPLLRSEALHLHLIAETIAAVLKTGDRKDRASSAASGRAARAAALGEVLSRLCMAGSCAIVADTLCSTAVRAWNGGDSALWVVCRDACGALRPQAARRIVPRVLESMSAARVRTDKPSCTIGLLSRALGSEVEGVREVVLDVLMRSTILVRPSSAAAMDLGASVLQRIARDGGGTSRRENGTENARDSLDTRPVPKLTVDASMLGEALDRVAAVWASGGFVDHVDISVQSHVTQFVSSGLERIIAERKTQKSSLSHPVVPILMRGVQLRLDSLVASTRRMGMDIAEQFSKILDPANPLRFDKDPDDDGDLGIEEKEPVVGLKPVGGSPSDPDHEATEAGTLATTPPLAAQIDPLPPKRSLLSELIERCPPGVGKGGVRKTDSKTATAQEPDEAEAAFLARCAGTGSDGDETDVDEDEDDDPDAAWDVSAPTPAAATASDASAADPTRIVGFTVSTNGVGRATASDTGSRSVAAGDNTDAWGGLWDTRLPGGSDDSDSESSPDEYTPIEDALDDDKQDLREVQPPGFLGVNLQYIRNTKSRAHMEAGSESLFKNVSSCPASELDHHAKPLVTALIHLWTVELFDSEKHVAQANLALVKITELRPLVAVQLLLKCVFNKEQTVHQRTLALETLALAAESMASSSLMATGEASSSSESKRLRATPRVGVAEDQEAKAKRRWEVIRARVARRTRRWGARRGEVPAETRNEFGAVAWLFFAPLIAWTTSPPPSFDPDAVHNAIILGRILSTLGRLVAASGRSSTETVRMSASLLELLLATRYHRSKAVRRETLVAAGRAIDAVPPFLLVKLGPSLQEVIEWLAQTRSADPDDGCRAVADAALAVAAKAYKEALSRSTSSGAAGGGTGTLALADMKMITSRVLGTQATADSNS